MITTFQGLCCIDWENKHLKEVALDTKGLLQTLDWTAERIPPNEQVEEARKTCLHPAPVVPSKRLENRTSPN